MLEGVALGLLFTAAVGVMTFALHQRLPYKRLLIITGVMLLVVLVVMVGEEVNEMQLAGWIGTTSIGNWPGWLGEWFSLFPNVETIVAQVLAIVLVVGSYLLAAVHPGLAAPSAVDSRPPRSPIARRSQRAAIRPDLCSRQGSRGPEVPGRGSRPVALRSRGCRESRRSRSSILFRRMRFPPGRGRWRRPSSRTLTAPATVATST